MIILKILIFILTAAWFLLGVWLVKNYQRLFGPNQDDPSETAGARSFGVAHIIAVWIGGMGLGIYFFFK